MKVRNLYENSIFILINFNQHTIIFIKDSAIVNLSMVAI